MHFTYCPECGAKLLPRVLGDEGAVPFCESCDRPFFDMFSTCVLSVVMSPSGEVALIRQSYGQQTHFVGVAGYMQCGETAEQAAMREITEEIGIVPHRVEYQFSAWHAAGAQLMLCFCAYAEKQPFTRSDEVAEAKWFSPKDARAAVREGSIIAQLLEAVLKKI